MICAMLVLSSLLAPRAGAFGVQEIPHVRCVCNYLFGEDPFDLEAWTRDLDGMKAAGFNAVWVVNVWAAYQPDADGEYDAAKLEWLRGVCRAAAERDMDVLLVVAYIGEGWGPKGVDVPAWPLIPKHRAQHARYLRWLAGGVADFDNVFYLLCTEEILPATLLYRPDERPECVTSFRSWAHRANPDVDYWNERWQTDYTWETLKPARTTDRKTWQTWLDHGRWFMYLMRQLLPPMSAAIREGDPDAVIGFHDFLIDPAVPYPSEERPQPGLCGFGFFSIGYYYVTDKSFEENMDGLRVRVEAAREYYPNLPIFCGETGLPVRKQPPETMAEDEALQARWFREALPYLIGEGVGYSIWSWRTVVESAEETHSLHREDGSPRPALDAIRDIHDEDGRVAQ
jgi:hypothetical protein